MYYEDLVEYGQALPQYEAPHEAYEGNPLRDAYPLVMTQRRSENTFHTESTKLCMACFVVAPILRADVGMNPIDMEARGLESGDVIEAFNERGSFQCAASPPKPYVRERRL